MARWPAVVDALVTLLPTLPGWEGVPVYDAKPATSAAPLRYATVGYVLDEDSAGGYERVRSQVTSLWEETGSVRVEVVAASGTADLPACRARAFELVDALQTALDADPQLGGVLSADATVDLAVSDVLQQSNARGAAVRALATVTYFDRS